MPLGFTGIISLVLRMRVAMETPRLFILRARCKYVETSGGPMDQHIVKLIAKLYQVENQTQQAKA